jgi:HlyD family secretion protein
MPRRGGGWLPSGTVLLLALLLGACTGPPPTATYRVERRDFSHKVTAEGTLKSATATSITVPPQVRNRVRIAWMAQDGIPVEAGDLIARFDAGEMEEELRDGQTDLTTTGYKITKAEVEGEGRLATITIDGEMAQLELDVAQQFQKTDQDLFSRQEIIESEIDETLAQTRLEHAREMRQIEGDLARTEVELLEIERRGAQLSVSQAREGLAALEVRAPHAGVLTWVRDWRGEIPQVGEQVWRGHTLAEIPQLDTLEAEVFVLEADAGGLEVGKTAKVVVEAHPERTFNATVRRVDAVAKPRFRGSPVQYFGVTLALEETVPAIMKPGQRVLATLLLEERPDALLVPRGAVVATEGERRVYVADGGGFTPRTVQVGSISLGMVVIEEGLEEGDVVALEGRAAALGFEVDEAPGGAGVGAGRGTG